MRLGLSVNPDVMAEPTIIQTLCLNLLHGFHLNSNTRMRNLLLQGGIKFRILVVNVLASDG